MLSAATRHGRDREPVVTDRLPAGLAGRVGALVETSEDTSGVLELALQTVEQANLVWTGEVSRTACRVRSACRAQSACQVVRTVPGASGIHFPDRTETGHRHKGRREAPWRDGLLGLCSVVLEPPADRADDLEPGQRPDEALDGVQGLGHDPLRGCGGRDLDDRSLVKVLKSRLRDSDAKT